MNPKVYTSKQVGDRLGVCSKTAGKVVIDGWIAQGRDAPVQVFIIPGGSNRRVVADSFDRYLIKHNIPLDEKNLAKEVTPVNTRFYKTGHIAKRLGITHNTASRVVVDGWIAQGRDAPVQAYVIPGSLDRRVVADSFDSWLERENIPKSQRFLKTGEVAECLEIAPRTAIKRAESHWTADYDGKRFTGEGYFRCFTIPGSQDRRYPVEDVLEAIYDCRMQIPEGLKRFYRHAENPKLDRILNAGADVYENAIQIGLVPEQARLVAKEVVSSMKLRTAA